MVVVLERAILVGGSHTQKLYVGIRINIALLFLGQDI